MSDEQDLPKPGPEPVDAGAGTLPAPESVPALPTVSPEVPGVWVVATRSRTRYVIVVQPDAPPAAIRLSYYGYDRNTWRPLLAAHALEDGVDRVPVRLGAPGLFQFTYNPDDWYQSTEVTRIDAYGLVAPSHIHLVVAAAREQLLGDIALAVRKATEETN